MIRRGERRAWRTAGLVILLPILFCAGPTPVGAETAPSRRPPSGVVLILNSYHPGFYWSDAEQAVIIDMLRVQKRDWLPVVEYLDTKRMPGSEYLEKVRQVFRTKYADRSLSLVFALDDPAFSFAVRYDDELFGGAPVVFCGVSNYSRALLRGRLNVTGVVDTSDPAGAIGLMLRLHPRTRQILVIHDYTAAGLAIRRDFEAVMSRFSDRVRFSFNGNSPFDDLLGSLEHLPDDTLVLLLSYAVDGTGQVFDTQKATEEISAHSRVPVYGHAEVRLGHGIVGGKLISPRVVGSLAGGLGMRVLDGEDPAAMPVLIGNTSRYMFDYAQLERFHVPLAALPPGSTILDQPVPFYVMHREVLIWSAAIVAVLAAIISLLVRSLLRQSRLEKARRVEELRVRGILESLPDQAWLTDRDLRYAAVNPAFCRFHGRRAEQFIGHTRDCIFPAAEAALYDAQDTTILGSGELLRVEQSSADPDGEPRWFETIKAPLRDAEGSIVGIVGIARDVTERRQTLEALRMDEARMESLVRIAQHDGADVQQLLDFALREALALTASRIGYIGRYDDRRREVSVISWSHATQGQLFVGDRRSTFPLTQAGFLTEAVQRGAPLILNDYAAAHPLKHGYPDGHVTLSRFMIVPVASGGRTEAVIVVGNKACDYEEVDVRQVTLLMDSVWKMVERRRAEQQLATIEEQLHHAQRMESIGRLTSGVAHDINNLLSPIIGYTELLMLDLPAGLRTRDDLKQIRGAAEAIKDLTRQLLVISRKQLLTTEPLDLRVVLQEFEKLLKRTIREDVTIRICLPETLSKVNADAGQVGQVLMNLAVNAQDAMPSGGTLTLALRDATVDESFASGHAGLLPGRYAVLSVSDTGIGIDPATRQHLFEPFFTTKKPGNGTGLGLSTVSGIVSEHGGTILVESSPGHGSSFHIYFPSADEISLRPVPDRPSVEQSPRGEETVLVVEDMPAVRRLTCTMLERHGYRVVAAESAQEALEIAGDQACPIDLLLTDLVMPGMHGGELYRRLSAIQPHLKALFMSAYANPMCPSEPQKGDGLAFIQKPFSLDALARKVREVLGPGARAREPVYASVESSA